MAGSDYPMDKKFMTVSPHPAFMTVSPHPALMSDGYFSQPRKQSKRLVGDEKCFKKRFIHRINGFSGYGVFKAANRRTAGALLGSQRSQKALILP